MPAKNQTRELMHSPPPQSLLWVFALCSLLSFIVQFLEISCYSHPLLRHKEIPRLAGLLHVLQKRECMIIQCLQICDSRKEAITKSTQIRKGWISLFHSCADNPSVVWLADPSHVAMQGWIIKPPSQIEGPKLIAYRAYSSMCIQKKRRLKNTFKGPLKRILEVQLIISNFYLQMNK